MLHSMQAPKHALQRLTNRALKVSSYSWHKQQPKHPLVVVLYASEKHVQLLVREACLRVHEAEALLRHLPLIRRRLRVTDVKTTAQAKPWQRRLVSNVGTWHPYVARSTAEQRRTIHVFCSTQQAHHVGRCYSINTVSIARGVSMLQGIKSYIKQSMFVIQKQFPHVVASN